MIEFKIKCETVGYIYLFMLNTFDIQLEMSKLLNVL